MPTPSPAPRHLAPSRPDFGRQHRRRLLPGRVRHGQSAAGPCPLPRQRTSHVDRPRARSLRRCPARSLRRCPARSLRADSTATLPSLAPPITIRPSHLADAPSPPHPRRRERRIRLRPAPSTCTMPDALVPLLPPRASACRPSAHDPACLIACLIVCLIAACRPSAHDPRRLRYVVAHHCRRGVRPRQPARIDRSHWGALLHRQ